MRKVLLILGQLDDDDVEWLIRHGRRVAVRAGEAIIHQGEPASHVHFVLGGQFRVHDARAGRDIAQLAGGDIVGEMSFVDAAPPSATVIAATDADLLSIPMRVLADHLARDPRCAARFYRAIAMYLSDRLRHATHPAGEGALDLRDDEGLDTDELDLNVLDAVHLAGARFERMLHGAVAEPAPR